MEKNDSSALPKPDFSLLCYSLGSQAMVALGQAKNPVTGEMGTDLGQAKYTIDLLEMLKEKTEGNRTEEETKVIMGFLFDLRMRYVEKSRKPAPRE
jgi:hypothetical protein